MVPIEVMVRSARLALQSKLSDSHDCLSVIEALGGRRHDAEKQVAVLLEAYQ